MRITQGAFSFLEDLTNDEIEAQIRYALTNGWAIMVEYTDDPHPRNNYWDMFKQPEFDLSPDEADVAMRDVVACREAFPNHYVKVVCYDSSLGRQTSALSFIVNRPEEEPGFRLERQDKADRQMRYTIHPYAHQDPVGRRYGSGGSLSSTRDGSSTTYGIGASTDEGIGES
ncbi:MAG: ribulose bisphosphate carboxylase small subunit [Solirubrobacteraceae bacterium]